MTDATIASHLRFYGRTFDGDATMAEPHPEHSGESITIMRVDPVLDTGIALICPVQETSGRLPDRFSAAPPIGSQLKSKPAVLTDALILTPPPGSPPRRLRAPPA